jgi:hypothetical protein
VQINNLAALASNPQATFFSAEFGSQAANNADYFSEDSWCDCSTGQNSTFRQTGSL